MGAQAGLAVRCGPCSAVSQFAAAEAQNHIYDSLGERYGMSFVASLPRCILMCVREGLRIIPGATSFLVLPNNVSRSTAVGAILRQDGAPGASAPGLVSPVATAPLELEYSPFEFVLAVSQDDRLLARMAQVPHAETCTTSSDRGSDAKWKLAGGGEVLNVLEALSQADVAA